MKEIEVQTENKDKELVKSSKVRIDENDDRIKVIVTVATRDHNNRQIPAEIAGRWHELIVKAFEENKKVITIPDYIKINTIKI